MSETTTDLLTKVEAALWLGDQRLAGMLLHKALLQDFTNRQTWFLLHSMRGAGQSLEDFQHSFAGKYYPHLAHLLDGPPARLEAAPVSSPGEGTQYCAVCGTALLPQAKFCPYCGAPVTQPEELPLEAPASPDLTEAAQAALDSSTEAPLPTEAEKAGLEPREAFTDTQAGAPEPAADTPEPRQEAFEPLPEELDLLFKRAARLAPDAPAGEAFADEVPEAEDEPQPLTAERRPYCPTCHKIFPPEALFCDSCGAPLFQMVNRLPTDPNQTSEQTPGQVKNATPSQASAAMPAAAPTPTKSPAQTPPGEGSLLIYRKKSPILEEITFSLWIDGAHRDEIGSNQKRLVTLPAGTHTIEMVSEQRCSDPITIEIPAKGIVRIACQPVGTSPEIIRPELKVIPTKAAAGTKTKNRPLPLALKVVLLALLFLIFIIGLGMIALFLIKLGVL